jgi:cold shock CspA family protein/ribosome-associated translation inhibitor RaiA
MPMQAPLEIIFHNVDRSPAVEAAIRERVVKLEQLAPNITSCRVTVEAPHKHHQQGNLYAVRIDLRYPGGELVANRSPSANHAHEDVYVAVRDAFRAARRRLQVRQRVRRGDVKPHQTLPHAVIASLDRARGCGRLRAHDGREIYFHRNSVINADFDRLEANLEVRFNEEAGDEGPQASSVYVLGKTPITP